MKFFVRFFIFIVIFFFFLDTVFAQEDFKVDFDTTYQIELDGASFVNQKITLVNNFSEKYVTAYDLRLEGLVPRDIAVLENDQELPFSVKLDGAQTIISVIFPNALVGKAKGRIFTIKYKLIDVAIKNGQVWEVIVPRVANSNAINSKILTLYVPKKFGLPAYISPEPRRRGSTDNHHFFVFEKDDLLKAGVVAAFGKFQVFDFDLAYHLQNLSALPKSETIALIPDTSYQRVFYTSIKPVPQEIKLDVDGNWIGVFEINGKEELDVKVAGSVQIFAEPQTKHANIAPRGDFQIREDKFWEIKEPKITELGNRYRSPKAIYDYVVNLLDYDYSRLKDEVERLGALGAISTPAKSVCREFTDLFIAISRSAGIPAREINGFAYTENSEIQPLSQVADVLHAWPEYWDFNKRLWMPADPTWAKTTGGIDFFNKLDLSHIAFSIHGSDSEIPLPAGSYKLASDLQKDIAVGFGQLPNLRTADIKVKIDRKSLYLPFALNTFVLTIENIGSAASYNLPVNVRAKGLAIAANFEDKQVIDFLAPFTKKEFAFATKAPFLNWRQNKEIAVEVVGLEPREQAEANMRLPQSEVVLIEVAVLFSLIILTIFSLYFVVRIINSFKTNTLK